MLQEAKHFVSLMNCDARKIENLLNYAQDLKAGKRNNCLQNKNLGMLFTVPSTRTRISFQVACQRLGGHAEHYSSLDLQLKNNESLIDTASVMGRYLDGIIVRLYDMNQYGKGRESLEVFMKNSGVPIINALDDKEHPCQVMADILTLKEKFGENYKKKRIVFSWGYTIRNKSLGVPHSLMTAGSLLGMNLVFAYPKEYDLDEEYVSFSKENVQKSGGTLEFTNDLMEASEGADCIYVKNWKSLALPVEAEEKYKQTLQQDWCISSKHFKRANEGAFYMDCMPFVRGEQVTAEVADGPNSIIYDQAENRLYAQMAVLAKLFE